MVAPGEDGYFRDGLHLNQKDRRFDNSIRSVNDFLHSFDQTNRDPLPSGEQKPFTRIKAPPQAISRTNQEVESGVLDGLQIRKLLPMAPDTAEFRLHHADLKVQAPMRGRAIFAPSQKHRFNSETTQEQTTAPPPIRRKNPWQVRNLSDLWLFFGPQLTILTALQLHCSYSLASFFGKRGMYDQNVPVYSAALIIYGISLLLSFIGLISCRGRDFDDYIPKLFGIGVLSAILDFISYLGQ